MYFLSGTGVCLDDGAEVPDRKYMISQLSSWVCRPMEEPG